MTYTIEIDNWKPASLNRARNPWVMHRAKREAATMIGTYAYKAGVPKATGKRFLTLEIIQHKGRGLDPDNLCKVTFDALKNTGYIKDDSQKWLEYSPPKITRGKQTKTIITLRDI